MEAIEVLRRPIYLDHILSVINKGMMLILVGQRRVGKSFVLLDLKRWLEENEPESNVLYLDKEQRLEEQMMTDVDLYEVATSALPKNGRNYLLIDEVQNISNYEAALRNLYAENRCQIVATGSNAQIFSSELGNRLGGRYIEIPIFSLTYSEFLRFHNLEDSETTLYQYFTIGGLPGLRNFNIKDNRQVSDYLQGVYNTILIKDVVRRENIRNIPLLINLARYIADTSGKIISPSTIAGTLISQGEKTSAPVISSYLNSLANALVFKAVWRYDLHGKKLFEKNFKYYFSDHGIRNYLCGFKVRENIERVMETVVWHHLLTQGFEVTVGVLRKGEVDFVATRFDQTIYLQVTYLLGSDETILREFGNLKSIDDNYPKYVISMDPIPGEVKGYPGIIHMHIRQFLQTQL